MANESYITVKILRGDYDERWEETYKLLFVPGQSVLQVLKRIYEDIDPTLAFYSSCRIGKCGLCRMLINGHLRMACATLAEGDLHLKPDPKGSLVRDLYVCYRNEEISS